MEGKIVALVFEAPNFVSSLKAHYSTSEFKVAKTVAHGGPGLDFNQAARYAGFVFLCGWLISQHPAGPTWNEHDFFGDHYAHKM